MAPETAGRLTVHVLDTGAGAPAAGMRLTLVRLHGEARETLGAFVTGIDGRCDRPLLAGEALRAGDYEIVFEVGAWRRSRHHAEPGFYELVPIRFRVGDPASGCHVPLILAPFGYATYRGS